MTQHAEIVNSPRVSASQETEKPVNIRKSFLDDYLNDPAVQKEIKSLIRYKKDGTPIYKSALRCTFNELFTCTKLLERKGYKPVHIENDDGVTKMQLGDSVALIYPGDTFTHETVLLNDYADYSQYDDGSMDSFVLFKHLFCNGDRKAAYVAAKKALGMWE